MRFCAEKVIKLENADVHLHYANNAGRGKDNVTVTFVVPGIKRRNQSKLYDATEILKQYRVSGWKGNVNIPAADIKHYGGLKKNNKGGGLK